LRQATKLTGDKELLTKEKEALNQSITKQKEEYQTE